ncbi:MAG: hypothetical protein Q8P41_05910 [Pseudomonadota bacterium]|nr:hypothetical protein [Pseudomonadota bacterium]
MNVRRPSRWDWSPDEVLAGSITALLLLLLAVVTVFGRTLIPDAPLGTTTALLTALMVAGALGLLTLLIAGRTQGLR